MHPYPTPTGEVCPDLSYLDPLMGTGVTFQPDSNCLISQNVQFFSLVDQGNSSLKVFLVSVPSYNSISAEAVGTWYMLFTKMAATTWFYIHPYFCFRKYTNSDYNFACGFDVGPVAAVTAVAEVLHQPHVPVVLAVAGVPATATTAEVIAVVGVPKNLQNAPVPAVLAVPAIKAVQHDLHGVFQQRLPNWNSQIWIAMAKSSVFKKHSPQHQILHQKSSRGYTALFQIISDNHPILSQYPHLLICAKPTQLAAKTMAQYFQHYHDFINTRAFLEENPIVLIRPLN